jgi:sodium transport system permease protein
LVEYELELAQRLLSLHGLSHQDLHTISVVMNDTASEAARSGGSALAMLMPYFLVIFLFAGSMNAGLDTTSGEKERGGLAILLVNQVSRTSIAWGKILYVSVVALCSASATFLGLLISVSLPGGMNALTGSSGNAVTIGSDALAVIVAALLSTALLCATLVTLIGCVARTVKEGSSYVMPLYMLVVLVGVTTMYMDPSKNTLLFLVPIVNTIFLMKESFLGMHQAPHLLLTIGSNLIFASAGAMLVSRLFNSERILQTV